MTTNQTAPNQSKKTAISPVKIVFLLVIWGAATIVMQLLTESRWWLAAIGGAGVVALILSFTLPEEKADPQPEEAPKA